MRRFTRVETFRGMELAGFGDVRSSLSGVELQRKKLRREASSRSVIREEAPGAGIALHAKEKLRHHESVGNGELQALLGSIAGFLCFIENGHQFGDFRLCGRAAVGMVRESGEDPINAGGSGGGIAQQDFLGRRLSFRGRVWAADFDGFGENVAVGVKGLGVRN